MFPSDAPLRPYWGHCDPDLGRDPRLGITALGYHDLMTFRSSKIFSFQKPHRKTKLENVKEASTIEDEKGIHFHESERDEWRKKIRQKALHDRTISFL